MRLILSAITLILAVLTTTPAHAQSVPPERAADAALIRAQIEAICQAFVDKDRQKLIETHGKDWRGFTPWSDHVIRGLDGYMDEATFDPQTPKGQGMVGYRLSDFDVVFYGNVAVASFLLEIDSVYGTQKGTNKLTLLDVFERQRTGWIQVASNTSSHPEEVDERMSRVRELGDDERRSLLTARDAVWRAWFAGDTKMLTKLLPPELITIEPESDSFGTFTSNLADARQFAASGAKLTRLVFPRTEVQAYGNTAILYTTYEFDLTASGKTNTHRGAATEVFARQKGQWVNTGWQLSPLPAPKPKTP